MRMLDLESAGATCESVAIYPRRFTIVIADHLAADLDELLCTRVSGAFQCRRIAESVTEAMAGLGSYGRADVSEVSVRMASSQRVCEL